MLLPEHARHIAELLVEIGMWQVIVTEIPTRCRSPS